MNALDTWSVYAIVGYLAFEKFYGKKADRKRKLRNGRIKTDYYQFYGPKPPRNGEWRKPSPMRGEPRTGEKTAKKGRNHVKSCRYLCICTQGKYKKTPGKNWEKVDIELIDGKEAEGRDLSGYAAVGFASGIYAGRFDRSLHAYLDTRPSLPRRFCCIPAVLIRAVSEKDFSARLGKRTSSARSIPLQGVDLRPLKLFGGMSKTIPTKKR